MVLLDATVINIALPRAELSLHFSNGNRQWVVTAYALAFGSLMLLGGRLSDLWGRRTALYVGLGGFALASALGGAATSFDMLVTARAIQGLLGAVGAGRPGCALGYLHGVQRARQGLRHFRDHWRIGRSDWAPARRRADPVGVVALVPLHQPHLRRSGGAGVAIFVPGGRSPDRSRLDVPGTLLGSVGLFAIVYGFSHAWMSGWGNVVTWGSIALGAVDSGGLRLVAEAQRPSVAATANSDESHAGWITDRPLIDLGQPYAVFLLLSYYLEETLHFSPLRTGFAFMPLVIAISLSGAFASGRLLARTGPVRSSLRAWR